MPRQNQKLNQLLEKAKDSALLAISIYNDPKTSFRTSGFLVMICIAWAALLHATFEKEKIKYFDVVEKTKRTKIIQNQEYFYYEKSKSKRYIKKDGENKAWELLVCAENKFTKDNAIYQNLNFLYKLRNKIEHRFLPEIDSEVLGECQACVLNFEKFLVSKFGDKHSIVGDFSIPLQMTLGVRKLPELGKNKIITFIRSYRNSLSSDLENDHNYATKFYLMPKIGNHKSSSDYALEFIKIDDLSNEQKLELDKLIIGIKSKKVEVEKKKYLPSKIVKIIKELGFNNFTMNIHINLWHKYDAQNTQKGYGCDVEGRWHWYDTWLEFVKKYCEEKFTKTTSI